MCNNLSSLFHLYSMSVWSKNKRYGNNIAPFFRTGVVSMFTSFLFTNAVLELIVNSNVCFKISTVAVFV